MRRLSSAATKATRDPRTDEIAGLQPALLASDRQRVILIRYAVGQSGALYARGGAQRRGHNREMVLDLALVGTGGMMPLPNRWLSSVLLRYKGRLILFDCGEGTQISLRVLGWGIKDIDLILISHIHGDHVTGLPGLLLTLGNAGRTDAVQIAGPAGLSRIVESLLAVAPFLPFEVNIRELQPGEYVLVGNLKATCGPAEHQVACFAYRIDVPRGRRFLPERARALDVPLGDWTRLQRGEAVGGVEPSAVLGPPRRGVSVGLATDTRPTEPVVHLMDQVDLLIGEGMYGSDEDQPRALERKHMTFREAAMLAKQARAKQLILTHFSPALAHPEEYAANAREVFAATIVGRDHFTLSLPFPPD
jgi:ribonuclease Z